MKKRRILITNRQAMKLRKLLLKSENEFLRQMNEAFFGDKSPKIVNQLQRIDNARRNLDCANPKRRCLIKNIWK